MRQPITTVTLTGVDMSTDLGGVVSLSEHCPALEFGILLSRSQAGSPGRYGTFGFIRDASEYLKANGVRVSLHLCGRAVHEFIAGDSEIETIAKPFDRIQINFNQHKTPVDLDILNARIDALGKPVITQHNEANAEVSTSITSPWHRVLFDASGGLGIRGGSWPQPLAGKMVGYAGGIGPDTVRDDIEAISALPLENDTWIDMENSLRVADRFNLPRCAELVRALPDEIRYPKTAFPRHA